LAETAKAVSRRTTRPFPLICNKLVTWAIRSTRHTFTMSLRSYSVRLSGLGRWVTNGLGNLSINRPWLRPVAIILKAIKCFRHLIAV
jgi:hypothetical protein